MRKNYLLILISLLFIIIFSSGCGGDSVPVISTPTAIQPTVQPTIATPTPHVISSLTELEAKRVTISARDGGKVTQGSMTVDIPANALQNDSSIEIARVNIKEVTASAGDDISEIYKISTGSKDVGTELQIPATVKIHVTNEEIPFIWNGIKWLPVDYTYDNDTQELILFLDYLDEDDDEWYESGGERGTRSGPLAVGVSKSKDTMLSFISSGKHFKMFYNNPQEKIYTESIAKTLEEAYDYYVNLGYNKPITSDLQSATGEKYVAVYIYPYSNSNPDPQSYGIAGTGGTLEINKERVDAITGKSVCYHELFHLIQFSYTDREAVFYNWFGEATAVCMEYKAINRPGEFFDCTSGEYWNTGIWNETFDNDDEYYTKFPFWSYMIKNYGASTNILHNIMKSSFKKHNGEEFNNIFKTQFGKDMITCLNENTEDYYMTGKFYNKTYFYNFKDRDVNQPYVSLVEKKAKEPDNSSLSISISRLSTKYVCYSSKNFHDTFKLELSGKSSNCKVKFFYLKNNNGSYSVTQEEINDTKTIHNFGTDFEYLFILIENTSINSNADVTVKTAVLSEE
jgi:hypothetical protein